MLDSSLQEIHDLWISGLLAFVGDFNQNPDVESLGKLKVLFEHYPHLKRIEFFQAPFRISSDVNYCPLEFYLTKPALLCWTRYSQELWLSDPDLILSNIRDSFVFIFKFCRDRKLVLSDYPIYREKHIWQYQSMMHVKDHYVSPYVMFSIGGFYEMVVNADPEVFQLYFGELCLQELKRKYEMSRIANKNCEFYSKIVDKTLMSGK